MCSLELVFFTCVFGLSTNGFSPLLDDLQNVNVISIGRKANEQMCDVLQFEWNVLKTAKKIRAAPNCKSPFITAYVLCGNDATSSVKCLQPFLQTTYLDKLASLRRSAFG